MQLQVEYLPVDQLRPYENNAKLHPAEQIEQIKKSITEFGFNDPIAIWGGENTIVEGHGRVIAARELGIAEVPVIRLDELSDEQRKAYGLVHNKLTMNSGFDMDLLSLEIEDLDIPMEQFGFEKLVDFDAEALDSLFKDAPEKEPKDETVTCPHCGETFVP